jgi:NIPSNAP
MPATRLRKSCRYGEGQESLPHGEGLLIYELRTYHCIPGKLPELLARFKNLTLPIWERHQIRQVGFWTVVVGESSADLIYMLAWDSMAEREERWEKFTADPEWIRGRAATEENGQLVASVSNSLLRPTEFSALQGWPM